MIDLLMVPKASQSIPKLFHVPGCTNVMHCSAAQALNVPPDSVCVCVCARLQDKRMGYDLMLGLNKVCATLQRNRSQVWPNGAQAQGSISQWTSQSHQIHSNTMNFMGHNPVGVVATWTKPGSKIGRPRKHAARTKS